MPVGEVGVVGAVEGGVPGPEALGMVEPRCHEVAFENGAAIRIAQACQTKMSIIRSALIIFIAKDATLQSALWWPLWGV